MKTSRHSTTLNTLMAIALMVGIAPINAQYSNCDYNRNLSGVPTSSQTREVENFIISDQTIVSPFSVTYNAGNFMSLDTGFRVLNGATFQAELDGCESECIPRDELCEDSCPEGFDLKFTETGQPYIPNQVVLTFPDNITDIGVQFPFIFINGLEINIVDTMYKYMEIIISSSTEPGSLSRCLCDRNIFLYENSNIIFDEGAVKRRNSSVSGASEEGGVYSFNYVVETNETPLPVLFDQEDQTREGNIQATIVAILDSGLDQDMVPSGSVYYNPIPSLWECGLMDQTGWNFIDNNDTISDVRGHGTLVTLTYLDAFQDIDTSNSIELQQILTVKVLNDCGQGTTYSTLCGLRYAEKKGAKVINASWGKYENDLNMQRQFEEVSQLGISIVCSAGNASLNLDEEPHFPSGYGSPFEYIINEEEGTFEEQQFENIFEVGGICRNVDAACGTQPENLPLVEYSNYREVMFAEACIGIEKLVPGVNIECSIEGTSFAAPQLSAALVLRWIDKGVPTSVEALIDDSQKIHPERSHYSYRLKNCNN